MDTNRVEASGVASLEQQNLEVVEQQEAHLANLSTIGARLESPRSSVVVVSLVAVSAAVVIVAAVVLVVVVVAVPSVVSQFH